MRRPRGPTSRLVLRLTTALGLAFATAPAAADPGASWAIPAEQGPKVFALLPPLGGTLAPTTATLDSIQIQRDQADVCFRDAAGVTPCVTLLHPSRAQASDGRTRFFAIRARAGTDAALLQAVAAWIAQREQGSPWVASRPTGGAAKPPPKGRRLRYAVIAVGLLALVAVWFATRRKPAAPAPAAKLAPRAQDDDTAGPKATG